MDIKAKIDELVEKIKSDKALQKKFKEEPVSAVEDLLDIDLPNDQIEKLIDGIKAKISLDDISDKLDNIGDALGGLFKRK